MVMQRSGRDGKHGTNGLYSHSPKRSLHGGFAGIIEIPWEFQQKAPDKKKIADWTPSEVKKPGKTHFLGVNNGPKCIHLGSKRRQTGAKDRYCCGAGSPGGSGGRYSGAVPGGPK
jgi:hypothetical protein